MIYKLKSNKTKDGQRKQDKTKISKNTIEIVLSGPTIAGHRAYT